MEVSGGMEEAGPSAAGKMAMDTFMAENAVATVEAADALYKYDSAQNKAFMDAEEWRNECVLGLPMPSHAASAFLLPAGAWSWAYAKVAVPAPEPELARLSPPPPPRPTHPRTYARAHPPPPIFAGAVDAVTNRPLGCLTNTTVCSLRLLLRLCYAARTTSRT